MRFQSRFSQASEREFGHVVVPTNDERDLGEGEVPKSSFRGHLCGNMPPESIPVPDGSVDPRSTYPVQGLLF